jgi:hypothetical protein
MKKRAANAASSTPKAKLTPQPIARFTADGGDMVVVERIIREGGPPLWQTNYVEWALLMKVQLQVVGACGMWSTLASVSDNPQE